MIYKNKGPPKRPLLCDKLEFISISFCMFWVSLLHNSYQATF